MVKTRKMRRQLQPSNPAPGWEGAWVVVRWRAWTIKHLSKKLNLTDDQQAKLKPILEDQRKQMEQIHGDSSLSREDRFSKMQALRQSADTQIKSVLTEEQQKSFDKMRAEQQDRMKQWRRGGENAPPAGASPDSQPQ
jgi:Spy/CpxP family protein refolding chaperone